MQGASLCKANGVPAQTPSIPRFPAGTAVADRNTCSLPAYGRLPLVHRTDQEQLATELENRIVERTEDPEAALLTSLAAQQELPKKRTKRSRRDQAFWRSLEQDLATQSKQDGLKHIIRHYLQEIVAHFDETAYQAAARLLPPALALLLNDISPVRILDGSLTETALPERIITQGHLEQLLHLKKDGATFIYAPTHSSNLDSLVLGNALYRLGLPPVLYGAGINLESDPFMRLFMHSLGAYKIDRKKTDPLYKDVLKEYVTLELESGSDNLFFPGGTRSRSGALETELKLGLLSTCLKAQRNLIEQGNPRRLYVVPVVLSYELVPEADHLASQLGEAQDESPRVSSRLHEFVKSLLQLEANVFVTFAAPLDAFGNPTSFDGESLSGSGALLQDVGASREDDVTRLGRAIEQSYGCNNVICATHLVAYCTQQRLAHNGGSEQVAGEGVPLEELLELLEATTSTLRQLAANDRVRISPDLENQPAPAIFERALGAFESYHDTNAVFLENRRVGQDPVLALFYANRLRGVL